MSVEGWDTMLGNVDRSRGVSAAESLKTRFRAARSLHHLPVKDKNKDKGNDPSNHIRIRLDRRPTPTSRTGHLSKFRPDLPTNCPRTMGAEFMWCTTRKQRMLPIL